MCLFTRRVLAFFSRVNPANSFNQPDFVYPARLIDQSLGQPRVNPGKQEGGGHENNQNIGEFSFRGILQPTTAFTGIVSAASQAGMSLPTERVNLVRVRG